MSLNTEVVVVTPFAQNCTIMWDGESESNDGVVVDPGGEIHRILDAIKRNNVSVKQIWITHGHIDHAAGAEELKEVLGVKIIGPHISDEPMLSNLTEQAQMFEMQDVRNVKPDKWLNEGDEVGFGNLMFEVFHCPGHAPGHVVFYNQKNKFAHVGDVLFKGSVGRTDLWGSNHDDLISSIKNKLFGWSDDTKFICGHGPESSIGEERKNNPFLK